MDTEIEMDMHQARPLISYAILESMKGDTGIAYSDLLSDESLINRYPEASDLVEDVHKLIALNMITVTPEMTEEEGEDYRLRLTSRGQRALKKPHE